MSPSEVKPEEQAELCAETAALYGYARTNRPDVDVEPQHRALLAAGVNKRAIFTDLIISGLNADGQIQLRALVNTVGEGDTIVVDRLYRLGRNYYRIADLLSGLKARGVKVYVTDHSAASLAEQAMCAVGACTPSYL